MKRLLALAVLLAARAAAADPGHVLVLHAGGDGDAAAHKAIDAHVLALAKHLPGNIEAGQISFTDAATAVGCTPGEGSCDQDVVSTMGVDEIVATKIAGGPGGSLVITVRRIPKSGPAREATATVPPGQSPDPALDASVGPLFGMTAPAATAPTEPAQPPPPAETPPPTPAPTPPPSTAQPTVPPPTTAPPPRTAQATNEPNDVTAAPNGQLAETPGPTNHRHLELTGMVGGGALVLVGMVMWGQANSTQDQINSAPTQTAADLQHLQSLESQGDAYATFGNVTFVAGLGLAAVSTYYYIRDGRRHAADHVAIAPALFDHGAGLTLSLGGDR
jgi:hypothetical protein